MASGLRRWAVLLLVLVFAASVASHASHGDHAAFAGPHSHEGASISQGASGEPCCPEEDCQPHGTICNMASGCSLCVAVVSTTVLALSVAEAPETQAEVGNLDRSVSPSFHPPKLFSNV
jgi:hypothetical protein